MKVDVYKLPNHRVKIEQTSIKREWMDQTDSAHAYKCFPVSLSNTIGWSISFLDDIKFIWDGISGPLDKHVKILEQGTQDICHTRRGNATISFNTGLYFKTEQNVSIISIPPPNYFFDGAIPFTSIISTSFYDDMYPLAWKIIKANEEMTIPAGMPVGTLIPISLTTLSKTELNIYDKNLGIYPSKEQRIRTKKIAELSKQGKWSNFYRDAVDYDGKSIGKHEVKSLKLKINDFTKKRTIWHDHRDSSF